MRKTAYITSPNSKNTEHGGGEIQNTALLVAAVLLPNSCKVCLSSAAFHSVWVSKSTAQNVRTTMKVQEPPEVPK